MSLLIRTVQYYAVIGSGLGILGVVLLFQLGGGEGMSDAIISGILSIVVLSFAVLSGPIIATFIGFATAESSISGIKQRSINSGIANGIGFAVFGIIVAMILWAGLTFVIGGGGSGGSGSGGGPIELGRLITLIILMTIPNALVGGTITFFAERQGEPRHSSPSTGEGGKIQENLAWAKQNRRVIATLAIIAILVVAGGAFSSVFNSSELSIGNTVEGEINPNGPTDPRYGDLSATHDFQGSAGVSVVVLLRSSQFDTYFLVTGPDGEYIIEEGGGETARGEFTLPSDGTYTIWVGSVSGDATGSYTISLINS